MKDAKVCTACGKLMERCRAATQRADGEIEWVCRRCWRELEYDKYMYEHRKEG